MSDRVTQIMEQKWGEFREQEPSLPADRQVAMRINDDQGHLAGYVLYQHTGDNHLSYLSPNDAGRSPYREIIAESARGAPELMNGSLLSNEDRRSLVNTMQQQFGTAPRTDRDNAAPAADRDLREPAHREDPPGGQVRYNADGSRMDQTFGGAMSGGLLQFFKPH